MNKIFYNLGKFTYRFRFLVIGIWLLGLLASLPVIPHIMDPFNSSGFENFKSSSYAADKLLFKSMDYQKNKILVLFKRKTLLGQKAFNQRVDVALNRLSKIEYKLKVIKAVKADSVLAAVVFKDNFELKAADIAAVKTAIRTPRGIDVYYGGEDVFVESVNQQTEIDLFHADMIAAPISVITLLVVFGSLIAAVIPILLGGFCALMMFAILNHLTHFMSLSIFTINIALLLGLCLSLDYALFIISRFREELVSKHESIEETIAVTMQTSGKAVFFSGLAVFASLSALLIFPINILMSVGVGGLCAVFLAVIAALTLLPAILSVLKNQVNRGSIFKVEFNKHRFWHKWATVVTKQPWLFAILGLTILICLAWPLKNIEIGISDFRILPKQSSGRAFYNAFLTDFTESDLVPITLIIKSKTSILDRKNIKRTTVLVDKIHQLKNVARVDSYINLLPYKTALGYPKEVQTILDTNVGDNIAVMQVISKHPSYAKETSALVDALRNLKQDGLGIYISGVPAANADVLQGIKSNMKPAVYLIIAVTFVVLMILLRSLFLPLKAIVMNVLSLAATYGLLVYVFQQGHLASLLNFEAQGSLDISMIVIIFCALFGFSMDYEVFLLSRIQESYGQSKDNRLSIIYGIAHSSRIITSAALIVIVLCGSFLVADVLMVKAFGLGIAAAIFIDAFIIRALLVPAIMSLTGSINWYLPSILAKFLPNNGRDL